MAASKPNAMANANINALIPLISPFKILPSIKSVKQLIKGTPGIKNKTEVANACSKFISSPAFTNAPANKEATSDPIKTQM